MDRSQTMKKQNEKKTRTSISSYRMYQNTHLIQNIQKNVFKKAFQNITCSVIEACFMKDP